MAEIVEALEGSIAPIECISQGPDGSISCSRESDPGHVCPTKLLWTQVRLAVVQTLQDTTLADLVLGPALVAGGALQGAGEHGATPAGKLRALAGPRQRTRPLASGA